MVSSVDAVGQGLAVEENVVICAGACSLTLLPALGGKISSLCVDEQELLQVPLHPYRARTPSMSFEESDAGGWDECLPSVAECTVQTPSGNILIPDHGDLWRVPWEVLESGADAATLRARSSSLPLELTRSMVLTSSDNGWKLHLLYTLANVGDFQTPWSWSAHPLFAVDPGDRILLPDEIRTVRVESSMDGSLDGETVDWPVAALHSGGALDLSVARDTTAGSGDKLFAGPLNEGCCALVRARLGLKLTMRFDPSLTPFLGLWLCYGGWPSGTGPQQVCVACEPTTAPVDSLAKTGPWSRWLDPGESFIWPMELSIERTAQPSGVEA